MIPASGESPRVPRRPVAPEQVAGDEAGTPRPRLPASLPRSRSVSGRPPSSSTRSVPSSTTPSSASCSGIRAELREAASGIGHAGDLQAQAAALDRRRWRGRRATTARRGSRVVERGVDHGGLHQRDAGGQAAGGRSLVGGTGSGELLCRHAKRLGGLASSRRGASSRAGLRPCGSRRLAALAAGFAGSWPWPRRLAPRFARAGHARLEGGHQVADVGRLRPSGPAPGFSRRPSPR